MPNNASYISRCLSIYFIIFFFYYLGQRGSDWTNWTRKSRRGGGKRSIFLLILLSITSVKISPHEYCFYSSSLLQRSHLLQWINDLIREVVSLEEDNLEVFYYLSTSEIWPDEKGGLIGLSTYLFFPYWTAMGTISGKAYF